MVTGSGPELRSGVDGDGDDEQATMAVLEEIIHAVHTLWGSLRVVQQQKWVE